MARAAESGDAGEHLSDEDERYVCGYCGRAFVVPSLARWHEARHEADE